MPLVGKPDCCVYRLSKILDDPIYEGFALEDRSSLKSGEHRTLALDFLPDDVSAKGRGWTAPRLIDAWTPRKVVGRVRAFNDYPCVSLSIPAFSRRAVDALRRFLEPNGELLPLVSPIGEYYAYNITTVADVLDEEKSEIVWMNEKLGVAAGIKNYKFDCRMMGGLSIFRIVQEMERAFVTHDFVAAASNAGLRGMDFRLVYSSEGGNAGGGPVPNSRGDGPARPSRRPSPALANTVVVVLPTSKSSKPSKVERNRVAAINDELDSLLYRAHQTPDDPDYVGTLAGHEHAGGAFRIFLSCPNADRLVERLWNRLVLLPWDGPIVVLKRYGDLHDPNCPEEVAFERSAP